MLYPMQLRNEDRKYLYILPLSGGMHLVHRQLQILPFWLTFPPSGNADQFAVASAVCPASFSKAGPLVWSSKPQPVQNFLFTSCKLTPYFSSMDLPQGFMYVATPPLQPDHSFPPRSPASGVDQLWFPDVVSKSQNSLIKSNSCTSLASKVVERCLKFATPCLQSINDVHLG